MGEDAKRHFEHYRLLIIPLVIRGARYVEFLIGGLSALAYTILKDMVVTTTRYTGTQCGIINIFAPLLR